MKRFFSTLKKTPMLFVFVLMVFLVTPVALFAQGESEQRAIITAIGVDKGIGQGYEVSLLTFIPTPNPTYSETTSLISANGKTIVEAIFNAQLAVGKKIGLSHARTTVVGEAVFDEDVAIVVDYLGRIASLSENTIFVSTNGKAKDFLTAAQSLGKQVGLKLDQLIGYNVSRVYLSDTTLENFYEGYFGASKTSMIGHLFVEEAKDDSPVTLSDIQPSQGGGGGGGGGGSEGGSMGASAESSGSGKPKQIINKGECMLLKKGKKVVVLTEAQVQSINILNSKAIGQIIHIDNVTDENFSNVNLTYAVRTKKVGTALRMERNNPIFGADVVLGLELIEIDGSREELQTNIEFAKISPKIAEIIELKMKKEFSDVLQLLRENKTDVLGVTTMIQNNHNKKFEEYFKNLEDQSDILNHINFQITIMVNSD